MRRSPPRRLSILTRFPVDRERLHGHIRAEARRLAEMGCPWHAVVDALRPATQGIWRDWSQADRRRFLTHLRPWWDVRRHRMARPVADRIEAARNSGQLRIHSGRIAGFVARNDAADVAWQPRGTAKTESLRVHRVINCTGPDTDVANASDPLVRSLLLSGLGCPDPLGLGFDVTGEGALRGGAPDLLFGVGPICRGALWEITAVPDIRTQCETLARSIAARVSVAVGPGTDEPEAVWHRLAGFGSPSTTARRGDKNSRPPVLEHSPIGWGEAGVEPARS